ncbi:MAG: hypothetical protein J6W96_05995 [Alphaproteobacteria bacterium]|nr:hypothetical protein [Alphaproteobacteria bacterium]
MDNKISFTARSNNYFAITKKVWNSAIPDTAYKQIDANRARLEKFARKNNLKITFTDGSNMLSEYHSGRESDYLSSKLVMEVEKKPALVSKIRTAFSNLAGKMSRKKEEPKLEVTVTSYYAKDSKNIPSLKEKGKIGFFVDYEPDNGYMHERINLDTVVDFLQKVTGTKSNKLLKLQ